jgi:xanthine dehydrogenase YagT iron-sulfur-binding subunit
MDKHDAEGRRDGGFSRRRFFNSVAAGATEAALLSLPQKAGAQEIVDGNLVKLSLRVNGESHTLMVEPRWTLLHVLRERLELTGTKQGCERGECGACTVLIDGVTRYACMTLALEAAGTQIITIEGLLKGSELGAVQEAFREEDAYQCGFCTCGQIMSVEGLLRKNANPTQEEIREGVSGNLCRCGAYAHIFKAAERAAALKKAEV